MKAKPGYKLEKWYFGNEIEIPDTWKIIPLNLLVTVLTNGFVGSVTEHYTDSKNGVLYVQGYNVEKNTFNFHGIKYVTKQFHEQHKKSSLKIGDLLTIQTGNIGTTTIVPKELVGSNCHALIISRLKMEIADPKFYCQYFNSMICQNTFKRIEIGTSLKHLNGSDMKKTFFILPSLIEQQKIASILGSVDDLINSYEKTIEITKKIQTGLVKQLLTKGIGHKNFKKIILKYNFLKITIPENWEIKNIKKISTLKNKSVKTGPFGLMLHSSDYVDEGTPLILVKNIQNGKIVDADIPKISKIDTDRLSNYKVREGDMIFTRVGRVGSSALVEKKHDGWLFSGQTLRIRFDNPEINSKFVYFYFHSELFNRILIPDILGITRDSINTKILEEIPIILPPKNEQDLIVSILSQIDSKRIDLENKKKTLNTLKKGLMQKLLTGQIRVYDN